jgi:hypothetical protein
VPFALKFLEDILTEKNKQGKIFCGVRKWMHRTAQTYDFGDLTVYEKV